MTSRRTRPGIALALALVFGLMLAGGEAWAAPPPTLEVQTIGSGVVTASGIQCGASHLACASAYASDPTSVTLKATPSAGWTFVRWDDDASGPCGVTATCTLSVTGDMYATAVFTTTAAVQLATVTASVSQDTSGASPVAEGNVTDTSTDSPIDCPTTSCSTQVITGSTLTMKETPASSSYFFYQWGGGCTGTHDWCSVYVTGNRTVSANFVTSATTTLTVEVDGGGSVAGAGMTCDSGTCTAQEPSNGKFTLTATAHSGYTFDHWDGACNGDQTTCTVDMSQDRSVTAVFVQVVPLLLNINGNGTVTGDSITCGPGPQTCNGTAAPGTTIQFQATPAATGGTVTWSGCTSAAGTICNVVVGSNPISITATFSGGTTGGGGSFVTLTVSVTGDGWVTASSGTTIYCTADGGPGCTAQVQQNAIVVLRANSAANNLFSPGWGGSCTVATSSCTLTMTTPKSVTAGFTGDDTTFDLTASVVGNGTVTGAGLNCKVTGSASCTSAQAADASVGITATPNPGYAFAGWSGACSGTSSSCTIAMSSDQSVTATFKSTASPTAHLTLSVVGSGTVTGLTTACVGKSATKPTECSGTVRTGATVNLKAVPAKGFVFTGWAGSCSGTKTTCSVVMSSDAEVLATFKPAPIAAGAKKPTVTKVSGGYRITLSYRAGEAGRLTVTTKPKTVTIRKTIKAGAGTLRLTVKKHARYVITLSLKSKSGTHTLRYTVKV